MRRVELFVQGFDQYAHGENARSRRNSGVCLSTVTQAEVERCFMYSSGNKRYPRTGRHFITSQCSAIYSNGNSSTTPPCRRHQIAPGSGLGGINIS